MEARAMSKHRSRTRFSRNTLSDARRELLIRQALQEMFEESLLEGSQQSPALGGAAIAAVNAALARSKTVEEGARIGAAHTVCIEASIAPDEELLCAAAAAETIWDARSLAMEYVEAKRKAPGEI
jgi:hypothetical protein